MTPDTPVGARADIVLAIDPGTAKCGVAIVRRPTTDAPDRSNVLYREVVETERLVACVLNLLPTYPGIDAILVGNATRGSVLRRALQAAMPTHIPVHAVEEAFTSQRARARYQIENPPQGWQRLVPPGMRTPPRPYDDYVAMLLAEDYFAANK